MKDTHALWWKAFRTWFGVAAMYLNLFALPLAVWCIARYTDRDISWIIGFSGLWLVGSVIGASLIGWHMAHYAEKKNRHENISIRIKALQKSIEIGLEWMLYTNPFSLLYAFCVLVLWERILIPIGRRIRLALVIF
jgi:hypothetical protein